MNECIYEWLNEWTKWMNEWIKEFIVALRWVALKHMEDIYFCTALQNEKIYITTLNKRKTKSKKERRKGKVKR